MSIPFMSPMPWPDEEELDESSEPLSIPDVPGASAMNR
jgi:hypothetical protein